MPALDNSMATAETAFDIDGSAANVVTAAVNLGRAGLPKNAYCTVLITEASAANFNAGSTRSAWAVFEYTTDNGTTYHKAGAGAFKCDANGMPKQGHTFPVSLDIVPELNNSDDIDWRVNFFLSANFAATNADNFNFQGYLGADTAFTGLVE